MKIRRAEFKSSGWVALSLALLLGLSGCLRTRAQMQEEAPEAEQTRAVSAGVQEVQPQGSYAVDELKAEVARLNGKIDDLERAQKEPKKEDPAKEELIKKLETRIAELEQAQMQMIEALKKMQQEPEKPKATPSELFRSGKEAFREKDYQRSVDLFTAYLKTNDPNHPEEAAYLIGESHYAQKNYRGAIVDFSGFNEKFAKSRRVPASLYKIGQCFEALGMKDDAKPFYQELVERYPKSPEARSAKSKVK